MRHFLVTTALGLMACACSSQPTPEAAPKADLARDEQAIRELDARWLKAVQSRDPSGAAAMFADDGVAYREHVDPLVGPAAFQAFEAKFYADNPKVNTTWTTDAVRVSQAGDIAIQTGEYHNAGLGPNGDREDRGRYLTVWKKVNGEWKVAHDIGSTTMPELATEKKP